MKFFLGAKNVSNREFKLIIGLKETLGGVQGGVCTPTINHGARHIQTKHVRTKTNKIVKLDDWMEDATIVAMSSPLHEVVALRSGHKVMWRHQAALKKSQE